MHRVSRTLFAGWALLLESSLVAAASLPPQTAAQLVRDAEAIVVGTVVDVSEAPTKDKSAAFTYVTIDVEQVVKGSTGAKLVTLEFLGGTVEDREIVLAGRPEFTLGEKYVFFVARNGRAGCPVLGWSQGLLRVVPRPEGKGETLTDHAGRPLLGLVDGDWHRGPGRIDASGRYFETPDKAPQVIAEDGVRIGFGSQASPAAPSLPSAALLRDLAALLRTEARSSGFVAGRELPSFDRTEVPDTYPPARWSGKDE